MKRIILIWFVLGAVCSFSAVNFVFPVKARADEATIDYQKQAIIFLCDDNAELTQTLDDLIGINVISFGAEIIITPSSHFYTIIKDVITAESKGQDYKEILDQLYRENTRLKSTLAQRTFKAERIR